MKTVLFTGGRSGIAYHVIQKLIKKNYFIYITAHTEQQVQSLQKIYQDFSNIECFKLDVTKKNDREKLENLDIDILVCNAAIGVGGSISELPISKLRKNFEVNVFSNFEIVQIVLKKMMEKESGKIVMMASLAGLLPIPFLGSYCASKASIIKLTETLRQELKIASSKVQIILVEPGLYHTGFNQVMLENKYDWMKDNTYFKKELDMIKNCENFVFGALESHNFNSIATPIVRAITRKKSPFLVRAPFYQVFGVKLYLLFKA